MTRRIHPPTHPKSAPKRKREDRDPIPVKRSHKKKADLGFTPIPPAEKGPFIAPTAVPAFQSGLQAEVPFVGEAPAAPKASSLSVSAYSLPLTPKRVLTPLEEAQEIAAESENVRDTSADTPLLTPELGSPSPKNNRRVRMQVHGSESEAPDISSEAIETLTEAADTVLGGLSLDEFFNGKTGTDDPQTDDPQPVTPQPVTPHPAPGPVLCVVLPLGASVTISVGATGDLSISTSGSLSLKS